MRVLVSFSGPFFDFDGIEDFNGKFYVNAVSLTNALAKANKILFIAGIKTDRVSCHNELSDEFPFDTCTDTFIDTFKGLNGTIKFVGRRSNSEDLFEKCVILLERGKVTRSSSIRL